MQLTAKLFQDGVCVGVATLKPHEYGTGSRGYKANSARAIVEGEECTLRVEVIVNHSKREKSTKPETEPETAAESAVA